MKKPLSLRFPLTSKQVASASTLLIAAAYGISANDVKAAEAQEMAPVIVEGNALGSANPYADPAAPYKVDYSASGKFTEPLLNTPKTITAITKEAIKDFGATTFKEAIRNQPGVTLGTGEGGNAFGDRIIIRGFEARNDVYIDGQRDPGVASRETFATEQVEIVKGPSATFAGRGTTGGAVDIISKRAVIDEIFSETEATLGTDNRKRVTFDTNQIVNDKFALRVNGLFNNSDVAGRDEVEDDRYGAAIAATIQPIDPLKVELDYYHLTTNAIADWGVPFDARTQKPMKVDRDNFYGLVERDFLDTNSNIGTAKVTYDFNPNLSLSNQLRYGVTDNAYIASPPESPNLVAQTVQARAKTRDQENRTIANQTNLRSDFNTGNFAHTVITGFEISREEITNIPYLVNPIAVTQSMFAPNPYNWTGTVNDGAVRSQSVINNWGLYAMDTVKLNEQWQLSGGLRYDDYHIDVETPAVVPYRLTSFAAENDTHFLNWHAGVVYKPLPNGSIYLAHSTSSNPSGEQVDGTGDGYGGLSTGNAALDPERNYSYEIGTKWNLFNEHLNLGFALFQIDKEDARVSTGTNIVALEGEQRVRGAEFNAAGRIGERLDLSGGIVWLDTEIVSSLIASQVGAEFPNVADLTFNLQAKYALTDKLSLGGTAYYSSEIHGGGFTAGKASLPSYWRFDLMGQYQITSSVSARLNILNVTDQEYYDAIYRSATPFAYIAPGRAAYLTLGYKF